jgi:hypothetical protein
MAVNMVGLVGGGRTVVRPPTGAPIDSIRIYAGAQRFTAASFTGHVKISKKTYECESVTLANTLIIYRYYEIWLTGQLTPQPQSPLKTYGQATSISIAAGDTSPR